MLWSLASPSQLLLLTLLVGSLLLMGIATVLIGVVVLLAVFVPLSIRKFATLSR